MRIKITGLERNDTGGGSTFCKNIAKGLSAFGYTPATEDYDILLIAGATLCTREEVQEAKAKGKSVVLRIDNIIEDSKNRSTGMSRLRDFSQLADVVIYQSEWAKRLLSPIAGDGVVIYNGVDTDVFFPNKEKTWNNKRIFYARHGRGEGKNFNVVQYFWRDYCLEKKDDTLVLAGNFSPDIIKINNPFEFHNGEEFEYKALLNQQQLAECMRSCDVALLPYFSDACSNTIIEAQACGLPVIYDNSGGTPEIIEMGRKIDFSEKAVDIVNFAIGQKKNFHPEDHKQRWGLESMAEKYHAVFKLLLKDF